MYNSFKKIHEKLTIGATGVSKMASTRNMNFAMSPKNQLMRAQTMADQGINLKKYGNPLEKYLSRYQYLNPYVRNYSK